MTANDEGFVLWFTGLSGAGKSTLAKAVMKELDLLAVKYESLDGDEVRENLARDLGFSKEDRDENIRRMTFVAKLLSRNGIGVVAAFIAPYKEMRDNVRKKCKNFIEIYVNCPLEVCEERDVKGLYKKAREGRIENFTGISDPYEIPENPEIELMTDKESIKECTMTVIEYLKGRGLIR